MTTRTTLFVGGAFVFVIVGATITASYFNMRFSIALGGFSMVALIVSAIFAANAYWLWTVSLPTCESNTCQLRNCKCLGRPSKVGIPEEGIAKHALVWECRCGYRYLESLEKPKRIYRIEQDGRLNKFKIKPHYFSRWRKDVS